MLRQAFEIRLELRPVLSRLGEFRRTLERLREAEALAERLNDDRRRGVLWALMTNIQSVFGELALPPQAETRGRTRSAKIAICSSSSRASAARNSRARCSTPQSASSVI
jgi:hypothetical protein